MKMKQIILIVIVGFLIVAVNCLRMDANDSSSTAESRFRIASVMIIKQKVQDEIDWYVERDLLSKQPRWDALTSEIPLAATKAAALSLAETKIHYPDITDWKIESVLIYSLSREWDLRGLDIASNVWYYQIRSVPTDTKKLEAMEDAGTDAEMYQVVLIRLLKKPCF